MSTSPSSMARFSCGLSHLGEVRMRLGALRDQQADETEETPDSFGTCDAHNSNLHLGKILRASR